MKTITLLVMLACGSLAASAQNVKVDAEETQLMLAASSTMTLQQELDKAGALGFHVVTSTTRGNTEMLVLLERDLKANEKLKWWDNWYSRIKYRYDSWNNDYIIIIKDRQ